MEWSAFLVSPPFPVVIAACVLVLYNLYHIAVAICGLKKQDDAPAIPAKTRFAILVAARNEAAVIGYLCNSLENLQYPKELYRVVVAPNNCTDDTETIARAHGAEIFRPKGEVSSKGEVLTQMVEEVLETQDFDAVCVFDADNLVHPDFLQQMNNALANGTQVAQGFRDSKNPSDTAVATAGSAWWWILSRFFNGGRETLGLSALISGSGFVVSCELLRKMGGWHTQTMTEDYEFTALCVLQGQRVHYVPKAIIYDEQPLAFKETVKQRKRWCTGGAQSARLLLGLLLRKGVRNRSPIALDLALIYLMPVLLVPTLFVSLYFGVWLAYQVIVFGTAQTLLALFFTATGIALLSLITLTILATVLMKWTCGKVLPHTFIGLLFFPFYVASWVPITVYSLFIKQTTWEPIAHTRGLNANQR